MWQRFTEGARRVILLAQEEAIRAQSSHVDTEHLLLGLCVLDEQQGIHLLERVGFDAQSVRTDVTNAVAQYPQRQIDEEPKLGQRAKHVLELGAAECRQALQNEVGVEHLLLALIREQEGMASQILRNQGAELEKWRPIIQEELSLKVSHSEIRDEELLLSLLERRPDLLVEILGLDVLALKKTRLQLLVRLNMFEQAALLRDEIENEHS